MVDRTEGLKYQTGQGYGALDAQSARDRLDGFSVVSGCGVSPGGSLSVDVAAGEALVGSGTTVSPGSTQNVSLAASDSTNPRKDTVWIDDTGTAQVATGAAETELPEGNARFNTFQPEPPFPSGDGTILAEVWVAAGATSLSSADIRDRRQPAETVADSIKTKLVRTKQADITNETFVRAERNSNTSSQTPGTFVNLFDRVSTDVRGEFNASQQFSPDESGEYFVSLFIDLRGSTSADDDIQVRVRNVTDGLSEAPQMRQGVGSATFSVGEFTHVFDFDSSKTYEFRATNIDSSFIINKSNTEGVISRVIVG